MNASTSRTGSTGEKLNNRTHRKLLVVDGQIGFTAGVGIADHWSGAARHSGERHDTHFRVAGPVVGWWGGGVVAQFQSVFMDNWLRATGRVLHGATYFPAIKPAGPCAAQMFSSSPSGGSDSMQLMHMLAISSARASIDLANSYLVPDALTIQVLTEAARRGVKVRVLKPGDLMASG